MKRKGKTQTKQNKNALAENRTRVTRVAGGYHTTRPRVLHDPSEKMRNFCLKGASEGERKNLFYVSHAKILF